MFKQATLLAAISSTSWAQTTFCGEISISQYKSVFNFRTYSGDLDQATTIGIGESLHLNSTNALCLRFDKSISVSSVTDYYHHDKQTYDFQSLSFAYLHRFNPESKASFFIGPSLSVNHFKQDVYIGGLTTKEVDTSLNAAFIIGKQFGQHIAFELHAGLPYSSASLVFRF